MGDTASGSEGDYKGLPVPQRSNMPSFCAGAHTRHVVRLWRTRLNEACMAVAWALPQPVPCDYLYQKMATVEGRLQLQQAAASSGVEPLPAGAALQEVPPEGGRGPKWFEQLRSGLHTTALWLRIRYATTTLRYSPPANYSGNQGQAPMPLRPAQPRNMAYTAYMCIRDTNEGSLHNK